MNNTTINRINPLIVTNVLLAVIAGSMLWSHVGPSVEPQAQAAMDDSGKSLTEWSAEQKAKEAEREAKAKAWRLEQDRQEALLRQQMNPVPRWHDLMEALWRIEIELSDIRHGR